MRIIYSFVVDGASAFYTQTRVFLSTLIAVGVSPSEIVANVTPNASAHTITLIKSFGVEVVPLQPIIDRKYCNKIAQLRNICPRASDVYVLCDTDLAFADALEPVISSKNVRAKSVDFANPPLKQLDFIRRELGVSTPPRISLTTCNHAPTYSTNCNGGLYIIPARVAADLARSWQHYASILHSRPRLLSRWRRHVDQVAFCFAMLSLGEDVEELPTEYNFPFHVRRHFGRFKFATPRVLHHHSSFSKGCFLPRTGHKIVDASVQKINVTLQSGVGSNAAAIMTCPK